MRELQRRVQELERERAALIAANQETEKKLAGLVEVNTTLKSLVKEYKGKNNALQAEVKKLSTYATEMRVCATS